MEETNALYGLDWWFGENYKTKLLKYLSIFMQSFIKTSNTAVSLSQCSSSSTRLCILSYFSDLDCHCKLWVLDICKLGLQLSVVLWVHYHNCSYLIPPVDHCLHFLFGNCIYVGRTTFTLLVQCFLRLTIFQTYCRFCK